LRLKSPQYELSDDVLHTSIACVLVKLLLVKWGKKTNFKFAISLKQTKVFSRSFDRRYPTYQRILWHWNFLLYFIKEKL